MATSAQVADGIRDLDVDWDDANALDEVLKNLDQVAQAMQEKFHTLGQKVQEQPGVHPKYGQAIQEISGDFSGISDKIKQAVGEGLVKS